MSIQENVLDKIKSGQLQMHSKWYFVVQGALIIGFAFLLFVVSAFLVSFIFFILHTSDISLLPRFGKNGIIVLFFIFPWVLVLVALIITGITGYLLKRFEFVYHKPLLYLPVALIFLVTFVGFMVQISSFHDNFRPYSLNHRLPFFASFYQMFRSPERGALSVGKIVSRNATGYSVRFRGGIAGSVVVDKTTRFPEGTSFVPGQMIIVLGLRQGNTVKADEIRLAPTRLPVPFEERIIK